MAGDRRQKEDGFTLIELLVVLALLAAMTAMIVPSLGITLHRSALGAAAVELRTALHAAASQAVSEGRTIVFRTEPGAGYRLDGVYHRLTATNDRAPGLRLAAAAGNGAIAFYPWGGSSGGRLWLEGAAGRRAIDIDAVSGRVSILR